MYLASIFQLCLNKAMEAIKQDYLQIYAPTKLSEAIKLWGSRKDLYEGLGISRQALMQWDEKLNHRQINEILGASIRAGLM